MRRSQISIILITLLITLNFFVPPSSAACSSSQLSQIRQLESQLQQKQRTLSQANDSLAKVNIKINQLQQDLNRYMKSKSSNSFVASTQRRLESALREQGQSMRNVSGAKSSYDSTYNNLTSAQRRCS